LVLPELAALLQAEVDLVGSITGIGGNSPVPFRSGLVRCDRQPASL
jgi:hypothetical protein